MDHSQLARCYQVFKYKVLPPFEKVRVLSNGDKIGKCYDDTIVNELAMNKDEILEYISNNHVEEEIE